MSEKLKKPSVLWAITGVSALIVFALGDLYYHYASFHSVIMMVLFAVLTALVFDLLFVLAIAVGRGGNKKLTAAITVPFSVAIVLALTVLPLILAESDRMYFNWAKTFSYVLFALDTAAFFVYLFLLFPALKLKNGLVAVALVLAISVTAISCWGALSRSVSDSLKKYEWGLDAPEYTDGTLSRVYNCGVMKGDEFHDGKKGVCPETNYLQVASHTSEKAFVSYCDGLKNKGYVLEDGSDRDAIVAKTFAKDGKLLHVYYNRAEKATRIITDPIGVSPKAASYAYDVQDGDVTKIYQYSLMYDDDCDPDYEYGGGIERCGMNYVIRLADNKLIVIDGGDICQASDSAVEGFYNLCKEITGGEDLTIACWLCTHAHGDHISFFSKFLRVYHENITLERYMYNFVNWKEVEGGNEDAWYSLFRRFEAYAPDAMQIKPHTGETFTFANAKIEILYTHEDAFNFNTNTTDIHNFNDTSVTYRFVFNDKTTFLVVGDMSVCAQYTVNQNYTAGTLKSDIIQAAHHGYNNLDILYPIFDAEYVFYPQGYDNAALGENRTAGHNYEVIKKYTAEENIFLTNRYTYGLFIAKDGTITKDPKNETEDRKYVGPEFWNGVYFDGSAN